MKIGGYQILDVYNYTFTIGTAVKVEGAYKLIKAMRGKPINTSRIRIGAVTYDAAYLAFIPDGTSYKATFGDKTITIAANDNVTFTNGIIGGGGGGGGGSTVTVTATATNGNEVGKINVDGVETILKSGNVGDSVEITQVQGSGAKIATITVNGSDTDIYAPSATGQVQSDWSETDTSDPSYIQNKPSLATVATSGSYNDLSSKPTIPSVSVTQIQGSGSKIATITVDGSDTDIYAPSATGQVQSDWSETDTSDPSYIQNKPSLATVATSGSYNDLSSKPTIPSVSVTQIQGSGSKIATITVDGSDTDIYAPSATGQVQSDWSETDTSDPSYIQNKPSLATVATSGSYNDLSNKPTIPAAQVQSDWSETDTSDPSYIQNKPTLATVATSGSYNDLSNKPTLATVATSGSYNDLSNKPTIPAAQVQSDWSESDSSDPSYIKNKPSIENDYSTSQKIIGTWIDGRILYQKTISFGSLPNATKKTVAHNISNMKECVYVQAIGKGSDNSWYPIPSVIGNSADQNILVSVSNTAIEINTFADWSGVATTYVTLRYTKTTG